MKRSAPAPANSPNSCFHRRALPKPFAAFIPRCYRATPDVRGFETVNRMSSLPVPENPVIKSRASANARGPSAKPDANPRARDPLTVLIAVPTLDVGAADAGAVGLVRIITAAGHRAIVISHAGRLVADVTAAGGEFIPLDVASNNPIVMLRSALELNALVRDRKCDVIHALGRSAAWSAYIAARLRGIPFMTSWYKGHRDQNIFKHWYNSVMARSDRVVATSEQLAQLINDRYGLPW